MVVIFAFFMYYAVITILGMIVLKCVSVFRLTFANLLLFIVGATAGTFAFPNLFVYCIHTINKMLKHDVISISHNGESVLVFFLVAVGAAIGGIGLVWLKIHFEKGPQNKERITSSQ